VSKFFASVYDYINSCELGQLDAIIVALVFFFGGCALIGGIFVLSFFAPSHPVEVQRVITPGDPQAAAVVRANAAANSTAYGLERFGQPRYEVCQPGMNGQAAAADGYSTY
jgi:hypothetical protein